MKLLGTLLMLTCGLLAQTPDLKSASGYPKMVQKQVTAWIEGAAEKMPEEQYAFKPDPAVAVLRPDSGPHRRCKLPLLFDGSRRNQSFAGNREDEDDEGGTEGRAARRLLLLQSGLRSLTDASANETVKAFGQERNKLGALWFNASHNLEHYGNLVVYMRLKGLVPPSSEQKPQ